MKPKRKRKSPVKHRIKRPLPAKSVKRPKKQKGRRNASSKGRKLHPVKVKPALSQRAQAAFNQGYNEGFNQGFVQGVQDGQTYLQ